MTQVRQLAKPDQATAGLDALTGLSGRPKFIADLARFLPGLEREAVLCLIDLDQFRFLNAVAGPQAADQALNQIAALLAAGLAPDDLIGRTGDDEFSVLFTGCSRAEARVRSDALLQRLSGYRLDCRDRVFTFTACVGLAVATATDRAEDILHVAMCACGAAKDGGHGNTVLAGEDGCHSERYQTDARVLTGLQSAIAGDRLRLYAQEIFSFDPGAGDVLQFELLVHMVDSDGTEFPPSVIIPAAERHGFIRQLDRWVLKAALIDNAALLHQLSHLCLSLNLSGQSLADPDLWPYVAGLFAQAGVPGDRIQFEITETAAIRDMAVALAFIESARAHGCKVALDDFGSGLSSFIYLRTFPVDCIKIDGAFVGNVTDPDSVDRAIVTAIVGVARDLGLTVVAEHVDSTEVLATLRQLGIDKVQGFLISQPQPFREMFEKGHD